MSALPMKGLLIEDNPGDVRLILEMLAADEIASLRDKWHWVVSADPAQQTRRGIYILARRNFKFPMFEVFDTPVNSVSCPTRDVTTVAPQALWGLNNKSVFRQAMHLWEMERQNIHSIWRNGRRDSVRRSCVSQKKSRAIRQIIA